VRKKRIAMEKNPKHNTKAKGKSKSHSPEIVGEYWDLHSFKYKSVSVPAIEKLTERYVEWVKKEDSLVFSDFLFQEGMSAEEFYRLAKRCPALAMVHPRIIKKLGARREVGGLKKNYSEKMVMFSMPNYDRSWRKLHEYHAELGSGNDEANGPKIVVQLQAFPDSDLVPPKIEDEE
jgi:hypothetical protein